MLRALVKEMDDRHLNLGALAGLEPATCCLRVGLKMKDVVG
jgi:hypothetical protein